MKRSVTTAPRRGRASASTIEAALREREGECVCGNLRMVARAVTAFYDAALKPAGIEANQMVMLWVAHSGGAKPASWHAHAAGMDQSTASRNLAVLEARGLVSSETSTSDRRQRIVRLTPRGRSVLFRAYPLWAKAQDELAAMTGHVGDIVAIGRLMRKVTRMLQDA